MRVGICKLSVDGGLRFLAFSPADRGRITGTEGPADAGQLEDFGGGSMLRYVIEKFLAGGGDFFRLHRTWGDFDRRLFDPADRL